MYLGTCRRLGPGAGTSISSIRAVATGLPFAVAVGLLVSCGGGPSADRPRPDDHQLIEGPTTQGGFQAILGTDDLSPGRHRLGFVLVSSRGVVSEPVVRVTLYAGGPGAEREVGGPLDAAYQPWPVGSRGLYTTFVEFQAPGTHRLSIEAPAEDGGVEIVELTFDVAEDTSAPAVGEKAVRSVTKTAADAASPTELTTGSLYNPDLYRVTLADAIDDDRPVVVVFASPAFCINAVCGPQVEVLSELQKAYGERASFVHVDLYDNPHEIQANLDQAVISQAVWDWNLPSNEWTFVIDGEGRVSSRFEAFATFSEIERELTKLF